MRRDLSSRTLVIKFNRSHVNIARATTSQSLLLLLARTTYTMVLFFTHIPFVVNHTINATPPERLQQDILLFVKHTTYDLMHENGTHIVVIRFYPLSKILVRAGKHLKYFWTWIVINLDSNFFQIPNFPTWRPHCGWTQGNQFTCR